MLLLSIECLQSGPEILRCATENLDRLAPDTVVAVLHHFAQRHSSADFSVDATSKTSADFRVVLRHLRKLLPRIRSCRSLSRLAWTLGKLEVRCADGAAALAHICAVCPLMLRKFTPQDLSNTLWSLARLKSGAVAKRVGGKPSSAEVLQLAQSILAQLSQRTDQLTAQCFSNSLWAAARLQPHGAELEDFLASCWRAIGISRHLAVFTPQGLANTIWAIAELHTGGVARLRAADEGLSARRICVAITAEATTRLCDFQPQELSMLSWACAKVFGKRPPASSPKARRGRGGRCTPEPQPPEVIACLQAIAKEALRRLPDFAPQGLSNIAWSLATMDLCGPKDDCSAPRQFLLKAIGMSSDRERLRAFSPQAIANLLWAAVRLEPPLGERLLVEAQVSMFAASVATESMLRIGEFTWRDLAGVAAALAHRGLRLPEGMAFLSLLVAHAAVRLEELTPQVMLNVAQSAARSGVAPAAMQALANGIAEAVLLQRVQFNDVDRRQWKEVREWCPPLPPAGTFQAYG